LIRNKGFTAEIAVDSEPTTVKDAASVMLLACFVVNVLKLKLFSISQLNQLAINLNMSKIS
jgi:hypothetical protein